MKISNEFWACLTRYHKCFLFFFVVVILRPEVGYSQQLTTQAFLGTSYEPVVSYKQEAKQVFPSPGKVLRRSLILPGWGQLTNKQAWKVPIVYGLLGGLTYYSITLTKRYHDYRAAFFNESNNVLDGRFGPTPANLVGQNTGLLRSRRDSFRNRRDFIYVTIFLAYVLNFVDAYVYAHLRSFDVSDNLSMNAILKPQILTTQTQSTLGLSLSVNLFNKKSYGRR